MEPTYNYNILISIKGTCVESIDSLNIECQRSHMAITRVHIEPSLHVHFPPELLLSVGDS